MHIVDVNKDGSVTVPQEVTEESAQTYMLPVLFMPFEEASKLELAKLNPLEVKLREIKEKYKDATIADLKDREGYELCKECVRDLRQFRGWCEKDRKNTKEYYHKMGLAIDKGYNKLWDEAEYFELQKKDLIQKFDEVKEKEKADKKRKMDERFASRMHELIKYGATFDGVSFILEAADQEDISQEGVSYEAVVIKESDEPVFEFIKAKFKKIFDGKEAARLAEEQKKNEEGDKIRKDREELQRLKKEKEDRDAAENVRLKEEMKKVYSARTSELQRIGFTFYFSTGIFDAYGISISPDDIARHDAETWDKFISEATPKIQEGRQADIDRKAALKKQADDDLREKVLKEQEEKKKLEELQRLDQLAQASDKEKWVIFIKEINTIMVGIPEMKSRKGQYVKKATIAKEKLEEIINL